MLHFSSCQLQVLTSKNTVWNVQCSVWSIKILSFLSIFQTFRIFIFLNLNDISKLCERGSNNIVCEKIKATVVVDFTVCLILNFICLVIFVFAFSFELHFCASHLRHYLHHPTSPPKLRMKYVVCSCPLEQTQTVEAYSDLMPLLAGRHHFSVLLKLLQLTVKINQLMTML